MYWVPNCVDIVYFVGNDLEASRIHNLTQIHIISIWDQSREHANIISYQLSPIISVRLQGDLAKLS